jgi:hypothetical protein
MTTKPGLRMAESIRGSEQALKGQNTVAIIRVSRFWQASQRSRLDTGVAASSEIDGLEAFGSEASHPEPLAPAPSTPRKARQGRDVRAILTWVGVVALSAGAAAAGTWQYQRRSVAAPVNGSLTVQSTPSGADVIIAGEAAGRTPLTVTLPPGSYDVQVGAEAQKRDIKVTIVAGGSVIMPVELPAATPALAATGSLDVQTDPARMLVSVDGIERGTAPTTIAGLEPGTHEVVVRGDRGTYRRSVTVKAGEALSLVISPVEPAAALPGWLAVSSSLSLQLREDGRLIGTTETDRLMLTSGDHEIELVNDQLGYRATRKFSITPGKTTTARIEPPEGTLNINALPWAEVWVDGQRIGETPIANLSRPIGSHEVLFRHPQLGERKQTVTVTLREPARLGLDMRSR